MIKDHLWIAFLNVKAKKIRSWLTMIGIIIGVTAVVALIGLGDGLKTAITSQFGISSTEVLTVQAGGLSAAGPPGTGVIKPLRVADSDAIQKLSDVDASIPRLLEALPVDFNDKQEIVYFVTFPDGEKRKVAEQIFEIKMERGRLLRDGDKNKIVLGYNFMSSDNQFKRGIIVGDRVTIKNQQYDVIGIMKKRGSFIFDNAAFINEQPLRDITGNKDKVSIIGVKAKSKEVLDSTKTQIEKLLRKRRDVKKGEEDFSVQTPQAALSSVNQILTGVQIFVVIVASISIIVGALGIINTMLTAVLERRNQIGIMKAIGAKNSDIFLIFLFESGILGLLGGFIGILIGTLMSYFGTVAINGLIGSSSIPKINFMLIGFAMLGSFLIGAAAGIIPAMRAARQHPVDALRG